MGVLAVLVTALLMSGSHAAEEEKAGSMPRWVEPRLRHLLGTRSHKVDAVVSNYEDGSSSLHHFASISQALAAAPPPPPAGGPAARYVIHIRAGVYNEVVSITRSDVTLMGDGMGRTIITGNRSKHTGHDMPNSAIVRVHGSGFMARDLTIQNTAGVSAGPAVALMSTSDRSICYRCDIHGFQDTLNADCNRQFYHSSNISGSVDFIFGHAKVVFQDCNILVRRPEMPNGHCVITAQGRNEPDNKSGFIFQGCSVTALPGVNLKGVSTFLGRPWKNHSMVIFMDCLLQDIIHPSGWESWNADIPVPDTIFYGEFQNRGDGAKTEERVHWPAFHVITDPAFAETFTVHNFIQGDDWLPQFGVKYKAGLE